MAETKKRVIRKAGAKSTARKRSTSEKIFIVVSILIAVSMIVALFASFGNGGFSSSGSELPAIPEIVAAVGSLLSGLI